MTVVAIDARCTACGMCVATCPVHVLAVGPRRPRVVGDCTACLECVEICPVDAIEVATR